MLTPKRPLVEVAVDTVAAAVAAVAAGADRLELCQALEVGGLTPSLGLLEAVVGRVPIPVFMMIRPRPGGFHYAGDEVDVMVREIRRAAAAGAAGVVVGPLTAARAVDRDALTALVAAAGGLPVTFHRALDETTDPDQALEFLRQAGVVRVLTSGRAPSAWEGRAVLADWVRRSGLIVVAGGGVRADHVADLVRATGAAEIHLSGVRAGDEPAGPGYGRASEPAPERVAAVVRALAPA